MFWGMSSSWGSVKLICIQCEIYTPVILLHNSIVEQKSSSRLITEGCIVTEHCWGQYNVACNIILR